ncbi:hypothetical protein DF157_26500 [Burkholderia cenocepacia]|nr:hypothetical protein DF157_26500 [Burkholderia cenocepacia]RQV34964.1 hypothetical protein DF027_27230 [Burkholderia cenocepacia]
MYRGCGARGRRQARSSARLGRAWRQRGRAGGASGALESAVSHGSVAATKEGGRGRAAARMPAFGAKWRDVT